MKQIRTDKHRSVAICLHIDKKDVDAGAAEDNQFAFEIGTILSIQVSFMEKERCPTVNMIDCVAHRIEL